VAESKISSLRFAYKLGIFLLMGDVSTTLIANWLGKSEANLIMNKIMNLYGFYTGLIIYFMFFAILTSIIFLYSNWIKHSKIRLEQILIYICIFCLWAFSVSRIFPVINNIQVILGYRLISRTFLRLDAIYIISFSYAFLKVINLYSKEQKNDIKKINSE